MRKEPGQFAYEAFRESGFAFAPLAFPEWDALTLDRRGAWDAVEKAVAERQISDQLPSVEFTAAQIHERWVERRKSEGVTSERVSQTQEELLVPFDQLNEASKFGYKQWVCSVYEVICRHTESEDQADLSDSNGICAACGGSTELVRPGRYTCVRCEGISFHRDHWGTYSTVITPKERHK